MDDRLIFLDVDGVLNSHAWFKKFNEKHGRNASIAGDRDGKGPSEHIDPKTVERLNRIVEVGKADVVLSSTWRAGRTVTQIQELLERSGFRGRVIGKTGHGFNGERGLQILNWLELTGNEKATVVVLDDEESDLGRVLGVLVKTDSKVGITDEDVMKAVEILKGER